MSVFSNKHMVVAMLVAPVLAVLAYYAIDALVGEKPQPAVEGESYPLVEMPGCRYGSGRCALENGDFVLELRPAGVAGGRLTLTMISAFPLEGVMIALVENSEDDAPPTAMQPTSGDGLGWSVKILRPDPGRHRLRLVASSAGSLYFGDVSTAFTQPEGAGPGGR